MNWKKLGVIFCPENNYPWMKSHASVPVAVHLKDDIFRIFFSTRDQNNRSHAGYVDFDLEKSKVVSISEKPVLLPGPPGLFDDAGVNPTCFLKEEGLFYYTGWHLPKSVPFSNQIGAARFENNQYEELKKVSRMPVLGKCEHESFSFSDPWVCNVNGTFFMWYNANTEWHLDSPDSYRCEIKLAFSQDGLHWKKRIESCLYLAEHESALTRPCILQDKDCFRMWYSVKSRGKYRIGYAESKDGQTWTRKDEQVGITVSPDGWDNDEVEYPFVFDHKGKRYMLYNGNAYGKTGIGLAELAAGKLA